jgi:LmbE family N-acetylglucosaminyl deacetylase
MLRLSLSGGAPRRLLAIGCHADDIELGAGGTILSLLAAGAVSEVTWVVLAASGARADEARQSAQAFAQGAPRLNVVVESFRDGFLPYVGTGVKDFFERLKAEVEPDVILTHTDDDRHQDHRLACELTWNTFRDHVILEYEIPKYDGDVGRPNVFVELDADTVERKLSLLSEHFATQGAKHWFDDELFRGLLRLRGMEARASSRYAEAFHCRKLPLSA